MRSAVSAVLAAVQATGQVGGVRAPVTSASGRQVLLQFSMKGDPDTAYNRVQPVEDAVTRVQAAHRDVTIEEVGQASVSKWFNDTIFRDFKQAEWTVVPLAIGILLVVFGALLAALLPVVLALTAFLAANGILALVSHAVHVDTSASSVMMLMGMAVGVDYCLFYLRREREERARGAAREAALRTAAATSGRSVLISGLTVMVAMAGMFLAGRADLRRLRDRDHLRRADRRRGLGDRAARDALAARRQGGARAHPVPRPGRRSRRRRPVLDRGARPGARPSGPVRGARDRPAARPGRARPQHAHRVPERAADAAVKHPDRAALRPHHGGVPRRSRPGRGRGEGTGHQVRRRHSGRSRP